MKKTLSVCVLSSICNVFKALWHLASVYYMKNMAETKEKIQLECRGRACSGMHGMELIGIGNNLAILQKTC